MLTELLPTSPLAWMCICPTSTLFQGQNVNSAILSGSPERVLSPTQKACVQWGEVSLQNVQVSLDASYRTQVSVGSCWAIHGQPKALLEREDLHSPWEQRECQQSCQHVKEHILTDTSLLSSTNFKILPVLISLGLVISSHCFLF